jgi:hypothetical protein
MKRAITAMDLYNHAEEIRLGQRRLSEGSGSAARRSVEPSFPFSSINLQSPRRGASVVEGGIVGRRTEPCP